ncbi:hypothetical protein EVAR_32014_1 [Eumeta japonica]|uniref:Uncharacterized protein n=1 Tax=Eumeta variegata TaxID=151549 RepID=A0A4C1YNA0_EUMVA|nr:hypothetical protein EVAR_32014_1 [Eumeta japonica]
MGASTRLDGGAARPPPAARARRQITLIVCIRLCTITGFRSPLEVSRVTTSSANNDRCPQRRSLAAKLDQKRNRLFVGIMKRESWRVIFTPLIASFFGTISRFIRRNKMLRPLCLSGDAPPARVSL